MLRGLRAVELLRFLLVASVVGPAAILALLGWSTYRATLADAEHEIVRTSEVAREHASKVFDSFRLVADRIQDQLDAQDDGAIRRSEGTLHRKFKALIEDLPQIQSFIVLDALAHPLVATAAYPVDGTADFRDRDYVQALAGGRTDAYISRVQTSRISGKSFFGWGRARHAADRSFAGIIDVAIAPDFFMRFYETLVSEAGTSLEGRVVTMIRDDGQVLVRYPPLERMPAILPPSNTFFAALRQNSDGGTYTDRAAFDQDAPQRVYAYRKVPGHPVYIVAGRSVATIAQEWRAGMVPFVWLGIPGAIALFLLTLATLQGARREQRALAQVRSEMSRRESAEDQLRQAQKMEAVGQLTGGIAHDFNNLLTVMRAAIDQLRRPDLPVERRGRYIEAISDTTARATKLTGQLLAFARRQALKPETFDVAENVTALVEMIRTLTGSRITIAVEIADQPLYVTADPSQFDTSIVNMAVNARDAMSGEGHIAISAGASDADPGPGNHGATTCGQVTVSVTDTGVGIDATHLPQIFEPFFTTKKVGQGTGLGLSQVFGFAKQSGGEIAVKSELGRGTTFTLSLPRVPAPARPFGSASPAAGGPPAAGGASAASVGRRILVVEDDTDVGAFAVQTLSDLGFDPVWAPDADRALAILARDPLHFDVILTDVVMPGISGIEFGQEVRRLYGDLPVVLTSGYSQVLAQKGTFGFELLHKPYSVGELTDVLSRAAPTRRAPDRSRPRAPTSDGAPA